MFIEFFIRGTLKMAEIQFIHRLREESIPKVQLTRSRDGSTGTATFFFENPSIFSNNIAQEGEIKGLILVDAEGSLTSGDVNARFINGKPTSIEAVYIMKSPETWDRFMRFMQRYSDENGLTFTKANNNL